MCRCNGWEGFYPPSTVRMFLFWFFIFAKLYTENRVGPTFCSPTRPFCDHSSLPTTTIHRPLYCLQRPDLSRDLSSPVYLSHCAPPVRLKYGRTQLLAVSSARLKPDVIARLRSLQIGTCLPRKRRGRHRGKQIPDSELRQGWTIPTLTGKTFHYRYPPQNKRSTSVNHDNLILIPCVKNESNNSTITLTLFNAQSLGQSCKKKRSAINDFIISNDIDIFCATESWFKESGDEPKLRDLSPDGYTPFSFPRPTSTCGGGIAFVISDRLVPYCDFQSSFSFIHTNFELAKLKLCIPNSPITNIFALYRPVPSKKNKFTPKEFIEQLPDFLEYVNEQSGKSVIIGDFNFHFNMPTIGYTPQVIDVFETFGLTQAVNDVTHRKGNTVDWVVFREDDNLLKSVTVDQNLASDHFAVNCVLYISRPNLPKQFRDVRNLKSINLSEFKKDLVSAMPAAPSALQLNSVLRATLDRHAPASRRLVTHRTNTEWFSSVGPELTAAKQERRRAERRWRATGLTVHRQIFQKARDRVTEIVHNAKSVFYSAKILACDTAKKLFNTTNNILGKVASNTLPTLYQLCELPQKFSDFFVGKIDKIREKLDNSTSVDTNKFPEKIYNGEKLTCFQPVSSEYVKKMCLKCAPKSCELDMIPTELLFQCIDEVVPSLTYVINSSITTGCVPDIFKSAIVRPLIKKPSLDKNVLKNYRPVSNLSFISKLLEKIILEQILDHLEKNSLFNCHQSAYRKSHSCETALLRIVNDLYRALDDGQVSLLALLDLSAAFDTIDHDKLFTRLRLSFGFDGKALDWVVSYLSGRTQKVCVNSKYSENAILKFGVPQGSVLGPVLFVLYASPVSDVIGLHAMLHESFADDTQLHQSAPIADIDSLITRVQDCIADVKDWMTLNKLQLNDDKTELMLVSPSKYSKHPALPTSITLNSNEILISSHVRSLGVTIDKNLTLEQQVSNICKVAYLELRRISSVRHLLTIDATKTLVCALVLSRIDYCNSLLAGAPKFLLDKLQRVQNNAARLVTKSSKFDHISPVLKSLHWLPIPNRISYKVSSITFSSLFESGPSYLSEILDIYVPKRSLRSSADDRNLVTPRSNLVKYGDRRFSVQAPKNWNALPYEIRHSNSITSFRSSLKTHLFKNNFCE